MARKTYQIDMPVDAQQEAFPAGVRQQLEAQLPYYQNQATAPSYYENHPYKAIFRGLANGGGIGAFSMPQMVEQAANERRAKAYQDFNAFYKSAIENQKAIDDRMIERNQALHDQSLTDYGKRQGLIDPNAPDLFPRSLPGMDGTPAKPTNVPIYSREYLDTVRKGLFGGSDINYLNALNNYTNQQNYALPGNALGGSNSDGNTLQAGAKMQQDVSAPPQAPFFVSDPQTIMQQMTSAGNNALNAGQKRYEFDQEAPNRLAQVQKLMAEGKAAEALALLRGAQTITEKQRPGLVRAQANQANARASLDNRTDPNLRGGGGGSALLNAMSPEQKQAYLDKQAGLNGQPITSKEAYQRAALEQQANEKDWSGNPTPKAQLAQMALGMMGGSGATQPKGINSQFQSPATGQTQRARAVLQRLKGQ